MRNAALPILLALTSIAASAPRKSVVVNRPHIIYRANDGVAAACASPKLACTHIDTEFYCLCERRGDGWLASPRIIATPSIYSTSDALLRHEMEHIVDVEKLLNEYAASLVMRSFATRQECGDFVDAEGKSFSRTMKTIERTTTIKRDGIRYAGPPVN